ncbi:hypothetical protein DFP73DRAFT_186009 [Morchella snyderi]|nr:hypothetical protein DFP73DRAFT_186009 [Morchella snyderi]
MLFSFSSSLFVASSFNFLFSAITTANSNFKTLARSSASSIFETVSPLKLSSFSSKSKSDSSIRFPGCQDGSVHYNSRVSHITERYTVEECEPLCPAFLGAGLLGDFRKTRFSEYAGQAQRVFYSLRPVNNVT